MKFNLLTEANSPQDLPEENTEDDTLPNDDELTKAVTTLVGKIKIDRTYDIPYLAGYNTNGHIIYLDRHIPNHDYDDYFILHEAVEVSLIDKYKLHYQLAHQIALRAERAAVEAAGIDWDEYMKITEEWVAKAWKEKVLRIPPDLDLTPYKDEKDQQLIKKMKAAQNKPSHNSQSPKGIAS